MAQITELTDMSCILDDSCLLDGVQLYDLIGAGSYAKVYKGEWKGTKVAVKQLHEIFSDAGDQEKGGLTKTFYKELGMNMKLRHPNIIQFLGVATHLIDSGAENGSASDNGDDSRAGVTSAAKGRRECEDFPVMVMELMHCTLNKRLAEYRETGALMPFSETVDIATDVAAALVYLHGKKPPIAHRDLAPKNVLLSSSGTAKLCDLGVAKWVNSSLKNTMGPGTLPYMPPEVRISTRYSPVMVDVYSFGVTLLEMCCGLEPKPKDFAQMTSPDGSYQLVPERMRRDLSFGALRPNHPLEDIIEQCLQTTADKRPTATQLLTTLQGMKEAGGYLKPLRGKSCSLCERKEVELTSLRQQLEEQQRELLRLYEANRTLENFRDEQLRMLKFKLQMAAKEGKKYQQQIQEMQEELEEQVQTNLQLEMTNDRANDINQLLKQKVEMDSHIHQVSPFRPRAGKLLEKSTSVRCLSEQRPIPKPRKRKESVPVTSKSIENLDDLSEDPFIPSRPRTLYRSTGISASTSSLSQLQREQMDDGGPTYLQLDAEAMVKAQKKDAVCAGGSKHHKSPKKHTLCEETEDPLYITIPVSEPPTPPPRDQEFKFSRRVPHALSVNSTLPRPNRLSVIDERDESLKSPCGSTTPSHKQRTTQSMRSPRRPEPHTLEPPRPALGRQHSRGDIHIAEVVSTVKSKNTRYLSAKKGELVKVTINVIDKKFCIVVKTNGESGTFRRKNLEQITPVEILYDPSNPALSSRTGVFNHIAQCSSHNHTWVSPVESSRIIILPSSIHSGDVGLLVKMTDFLLCCTDNEKESHFEIDLREQRLLKLAGYVLQCHSEGCNGAPLHWKLEGSHNGQSWTHLSDESGKYFEKRFTNYFAVTNPMPCRYFKLTQLGENSQDNYRFCLSGIELYGSLYSSVVEERYTRRV